MAEASIRQLSLDDLKRIVRSAQLDLAEEDLERLYPEIAGYLAAVSRLREIDLGETEPATTFRLEVAQ